MDNQGGASSSILVSIIISKYYFKTSKTSRECKQVVNKCTISISFGCLWKEILGVQLEAFLGSKLEGFYRLVECTFFESASKLEASVWQVEQDDR
jgi:hypothetical protein